MFAQMKSRPKAHVCTCDDCAAERERRSKMTPEEKRRQDRSEIWLMVFVFGALFGVMMLMTLCTERVNETSKPAIAHPCVCPDEN